MELLDEYYCPICSNDLVKQEISQNKYILKCVDKICYYITPINPPTQFDKMMNKLKSFKFKRTYRKHID